MKELDIIHSEIQYDIDQLKEEVAKLESELNGFKDKQVVINSKVIDFIKAFIK